MIISEMSDDLISRQAAIYAAMQDVSDKRTHEFNAGATRAANRIKSLPSAQPKQTDCEYCHEDSEGYSRPIEKNSRAWLIRRGRTMKLRIVFKGGWSECDILYCPMCGRRLADG